MLQPTGHQRCVREISANPTKGSEWNIALGPPDPGCWGWIRAFIKNFFFFFPTLEAPLLLGLLESLDFAVFEGYEDPVTHILSHGCHTNSVGIKLRKGKSLEKLIPLFLIILYIFVWNIVKDRIFFMNLFEPQNADITFIRNFQIKHDVIINFAFTLRLTEMSCI